MRQRAKIQIVHLFNEFCDAGAKAPSDAVVIAERLGFKRFFVRRKVLSTSPGCLRIIEKVVWFFKMYLYCWRMPQRAIVFIQSNSELFSGRLGFRLVDMWRKRRQANIIILVHDIDFLRGACVNEEGKMLSNSMKEISRLSDVLIIHNAAMRVCLERAGISADKLVEIGLFDYLASEFESKAERRFNEIVIAGNLSLQKAAYLSSLGEVQRVHWNLFGPNFGSGKIASDNITYCGCFPPDELPRHLKGAFGLVWDGTSIDSCTGSYGEYLRFNNPHKTSMYLACGIPIIIWSHAALADFVVKEGVGVKVDSLRDISGVLDKITPDQYWQLVGNARRIGSRLRKGYYLSQAIDRAEKVISST